MVKCPELYPETYNESKNVVNVEILNSLRACIFQKSSCQDNTIYFMKEHFEYIQYVHFG